MCLTFINYMASMPHFFIHFFHFPIQYFHQSFMNLFFLIFLYYLIFFISPFTSLDFFPLLPSYSMPTWTSEINDTTFSSIILFPPLAIPCSSIFFSSNKACLYYKIFLYYYQVQFRLISLYLFSPRKVCLRYLIFY